MLKKGWLEEQGKIASDDISRWTLWMRREAGLDPRSAANKIQVKSVDKKKK